ncbi:MAG TPA: cytochrome c, partial [Bryobacteraceae bacterium]
VACNVSLSNAPLRAGREGDAERGKAAFVELGCHNCHRVAGVDLPAAGIATVPVLLGGEVDREISDAYLEAQVLDPFYRHTAPASSRLATAVQARMPGYANRMTVRQLTDIVAFLKTHSHLRPLPPETYLSGNRHRGSLGRGIERRHGV